MFAAADGGSCPGEALLPYDCVRLLSRSDPRGGQAVTSRFGDRLVGGFVGDVIAGACVRVAAVAVAAG